MKMDVVLSSPGHFEDDGTPYKNEEIREWSGVDQLTGMLEQARIETGRWRAYNNGSAHSYGKVVDSRQRNSQDGSIVQKARRQVEVFQSQEPGRRVQVVRSSQWSSSRVTDNLDHPSILGTSPKFPFLKRSTSDEEISLFPMDHLDKSPSFARASKLRRSLQIPNHRSRITISPPSPENLDSTRCLASPYALERGIGEGTESKTSIKLESHGSSNHIDKSPENRYSPEKSLESHYIPISTAITLRDPKKSEISITGNAKFSPLPLRKFSGSPLPLKKFPTSVENSSRTHQISQRSQVTVVNLINSPKTSIVTLGFPDSNVPSICSSKKKVGFCKTEIHFAAESGKVNIVETDGKPPPTNKFRRRKRNQNPLKETDLGISDLGEKKVWIKPEGNPRIHTTTICLGDSSDKIDFKTSGDLESPKAVSEIISRGSFVSKDSENNKVLSTVVTTHEPTIARVEDNLPSLKVTSSKKPLEPKNSLETKRSLDLKKIAERKISLDRKKSIDRQPSLERKRSFETKSSLDRKNSVSRRNSVNRQIFIDRKKSLERKQSLDRGENLQADKMELKEEKEENDEIQPKTDKEPSVSRDDKTLDSVPLYVNVFGRPQDAFPVYENYRISEEKKIPEKKSDKEAKVPRRKIKSPSNGVKRSPMGVRGAHGGSSSLLRNKEVARVRTSKRPPSGDGTRVKKQPMEVVYKTAVYNMKNEKLSKPTTVKTKPGPRLINDLICGAKPRKITISSKRKGSTSSQGTKTSSQVPR